MKARRRGWRAGSALPVRFPATMAEHRRGRPCPAGSADGLASVARGVTLIEMLTVIAVLALLMAVVLPAVMDTRDAARRVGCANNLRQIGVALADFHAGDNSFPGVFSGHVRFPGHYVGDWDMSPSGLIAPQLDAGSYDPKLLRSWPHQPPPWNDGPAPATLRCPADGQTAWDPAASNYRYCRGVMPLWPESPGGVFDGLYRGRRAADVPNGLSKTVFVSERLTEADRREDADRGYLLLDESRGEHVVAACLAANERPAPRVYRFLGAKLGGDWLSGQFAHASYYHAFPPNAAYTDCVPDGRLLTALVSARSRHPGGVNVLYGDGHGAFAADAVDLRIWHSLAQRDDGA